jgi:50S ribosomal subunit-associated GTPase HflX
LERVIAVTAYERNSENNIKEKTEEFVSLIEAADAEVVIQVEQALQKMHPATWNVLPSVFLSVTNLIVFP